MAVSTVMCNRLFVSTDSGEDLSLIRSDQFIFGPATSEEVRSVQGVLKHQNVWSLLCRFGGCSCHFRHLMHESIDLGFAESADWLPEDDDDVFATRGVYDFLADLVDHGDKVDLVDIWDNDFPADVPRLVVSLSEVSRETFRFFEGCAFELTK